MVAAAVTLTACAGMPEPEPAGTPRKETVWAVTDAAELVRFNAGQPHKLLQRTALQGLDRGDRLVGIDYRVARGVLYALSAGGRLYTLDTKTGRLTAVGNAPPVVLQGERFGFDFNPAADRVRVVSDSGQNLRLHPDTGALAATDPPLSWAAPGQPAPRIAAAAYTYNKKDEKLTTNYAIDLVAGTLVTQGSIEGAQPVVSPNTGKLAVVGLLGTGALDAAAFDIADTDNTALAALRSSGRTRLYLVDLVSGRAAALGMVGDGRALWGLAIEP
nr:DUF4394 domain-containing protein [Schlegelella koreensis]